MRYSDSGCFYTVTVSARPVTFQFDRSNGDLVDSNDAHHQPNADGGAIMALAADAQAYGQRVSA